jgi:hypothetical protein
MPDQTTVRIFISSPSDVRPERLRAEQIIKRLDREFAYRFRVEAVLWEREPLVATHHFQDPRNIPHARDTDIVVVILWSRLGVPLPADTFRGAISGRTVTGTEWEFEDALAGARENGVPDLLLYRKQARPIGELHDRKAVEERLAQLDLVQDFVGRWFRAEDGKGYTAASHSFATAAAFEEQLYTHLRELLERRAGAHLENVAIRWHEAPFRGLLSFEYEHAPVFFGRRRATNEVRELLAQREAGGCAFVLVLGASGSGKSSLVKAGLLPDLMLPGMIGRVALVRWGLLRPSEAPGDLVGALASALLADTALPELATLHFPRDELAALLREAPVRAAPVIRHGLAEAGKSAQPPLAEHSEARVIIIVDQLEELFTLDGIEDSERIAFVAALDALARSGRVWVVATMRSDFYDRLEAVASLARLAAADACYRLLPPDDAELGQIIRQPALEAGLRFAVDARSGISLDEIIRQAAAKDRNALPLLSFLLDQLWQRRTERGELTFEVYQDLGQLEGALGRRAEEVFLEQPEIVQAALPRTLRALVTVGQGTQMAVAARPAPLKDFPDGSPERALVAALIAPQARLLVADEEVGGGSARVRVAHEAFLTHWPRARDWVAERPAELQLEERIEAEAARWHGTPDIDKPSLLRPAGLPLSEAEDLLDRRRDELSATAIAFVEASIAAETLRQQAERQRIEAEETLKREAAGAELRRQQQETEAAREREEAARRIASRTRIGLVVASALFLVALALAGLSWQRTREATAAQAEAVAAQADATQQAEKAKAAAAEAIAQRRVAEQREREALLAQSQFLTERARKALLDEKPELAMLIALQALPTDIEAENSRPIWNPAIGVLSEARSRDRIRATLDGHLSLVTSAAFSPDGSRVVTASWDKTARLWDAKTGAAIATLEGHQDTVQSAAFSPDGSRVVTASDDKTARLWETWPMLRDDSVVYAAITAIRALSGKEERELFLKPAEGGRDRMDINDDPGTACDRLAGHPFDPRRRGSGQPFAVIDPDSASKACQEAVDAYPEEPRYRFQLARAFERGKQIDKAVALRQAAVTAGYPAAAYALASDYERGSGVTEDPVEALRLYRLAVDGGFILASREIGRLYWAGTGVTQDRDEALRLFVYGAEQGNPFAHWQLGQIFERGEHVTQDLEKALFHHAISARLFSDVGYQVEAAHEISRRGSLARALRPETTVGVARRAIGWHPKDALH